MQKNTFPKAAKYNWLAGLTDGDGTFSFSINKKETNQWNCTFKIAASLRNARILRHCHTLLECGSVNLKSGKESAEFRIRDRKVLRGVIVPLFEKHPLWTTKAFYFERWCRALDIMDSCRTPDEKHQLLLLLRDSCPLADYKAPSWGVGQVPENGPSKAWISGFLEAEGSFFICDKGGREKEKMVHAFGVTQKLDKVVLEWIREKFHIPSQVADRRPPGKNPYWKLETTNKRVLQRLGQYFKGQFRGRKSLEYRIWYRTFKWRNNNARLRGVQKLLRMVRAVPDGGNE